MNAEGAMAASAEERAREWKDAGPGRSIEREGLYLVAREGGVKVESHPFLPGLVDLLESTSRLERRRTRPGSELQQGMG
jgi:hypothetical protein